MAINIKKVKQTTENNQKNLMLQEDYTNKVFKMKKMIEDIFLSLNKYGRIINFAEMASEYEATKELSYGYQRSDLACLLAAHHVHSVFHQIRIHNFDEALRLIADYKKSGWLTSQSTNLENWEQKHPKPIDLKQYLSPKAGELEKKWGLNIVEIHNLIKEIQQKTANFKKLYQELEQMSSSNKRDVNLDVIDESWSKKASDILSSIENLFNSHKNTKAQQESKPVETKGGVTSIFSSFFSSSSAETSKQAKEEKPTSSWKFTLDPRKWFQNSYVKAGSNEGLNENKSEQENNPTSADLGSDLVAKKIHTFYHSLITYTYTGAKAACFAEAIGNIQRISNDCAIERTKEVEKQYKKHASPSSVSDEKSMVVIQPESTKTLVVSNGGSSTQSSVIDESIKNNCESEMESYYVFAENCNYIFSEFTSVDSEIENSLLKAATVNVNINKQGEIVLFDSEGLEVRMSYVPQEYGEADFLKLLSLSPSQPQITGADETLKITDGQE